MELPDSCRSWLLCGVALLAAACLYYNRSAATLPAKLGDLEVAGQITVLDLVRLINQVNRDTDGDSVSDLAELLQGTDPLSGRTEIALNNPLIEPSAII